MGTPPTPASLGQQATRIVAYVAVVLLPLVVSVLARLRTFELSLLEAGKAAALLGLGVVTMQLVLSARLLWAERPFGLDRLYRFHRVMGGVALLLFLAHPVLLAGGGYGSDLLTNLRAPWPIWAGKLALLLLLLMVLVATFRRQLGVEFGRWRAAHRIAALLLLLVGTGHALNVADGLHSLPIRLAFVVTVAVGAVALAAYRASPAVSGRGPQWRVESVRPETHNVHTLTLSPPVGMRDGRHLPGQFRFLRPAGRGSIHEDHPFTVTSDPLADGALTFTIKASGDFTRAIPSVEPEHAVCLSPPYGRFSYLLHPQETALVFIAGGIGITPLMSMIRHMRSSGADRDVLLIYGNRTEADIVFRDELSTLEASGRPRLRVVHVLSRPSGSWEGETGRIDRERIARLCGEVIGKGFYVCGPRAMMRDVLRALRAVGVPRSRIHYEHFDL